MTPSWPPLVRDELEWDEMPGHTSWSILVPVDVARLPGLPAAREAISRLPILLHPDHYLHVTLRQLDGVGSVDTESLDAIADLIAATPGWTATVKGIHAFPTAVWANADRDGRFLTVIDKLLAEIGNLPEHPYRRNAVCHMTLGYCQGACAPQRVQEALAPFADFELGKIDVREAVLAELYLDRAYPRWAVRRRFPFGEPS